MKEKNAFEKRAPDFKTISKIPINPPMAAPKVWVSAARCERFPLSLSGIIVGNALYSGR